jgi:hypothetical protein
VTYRGRTGFFLADGRPQWRVLGEAVAVDLPGGRTLYALLAGNDRDVDYGARIPDRAYSDDGRIHGPPPPVQLYPKAPDKGVFRITDPLPMLVMFADPKDSKSIMRIDPRNLSGTFGPGYALKSITLQMTDETVTREIEKRLPNFGKGSGFDRWYVGLSMDDPRRLTFDDFVKRGRK